MHVINLGLSSDPISITVYSDFAIDSLKRLHRRLLARSICVGDIGIGTATVASVTGLLPKFRGLASLPNELRPLMIDKLVAGLSAARVSGVSCEWAKGWKCCFRFRFGIAMAEELEAMVYGRLGDSGVEGD